MISSRARLCLATTAAVAASAALPASAPAGRLTRAVLHDINVARVQNGLPRVHADRRLARGARRHSSTMARRHFFDHGAWASRVRRYAHTAVVGEILGYLPIEAGEARAIVNAWMADPAHRAIILSGRYHRAGVGRAHANWNGSPTAVYTVDFAR